MTSHQVDLMKLRELFVQAENGSMTDELLTEIEERACKLFTPDVVRLVKVLAADAREWRKRATVGKTCGYGNPHCLFSGRHMGSCSD